MSGKISVKPYYKVRDSRLNEINYVLTQCLPKYFPTVLIDIIIEDLMGIEDMEIIEEIRHQLVDGMNETVKTVWRKMCMLGVTDFNISFKKVFTAYHLPEQQKFLEFLIDPDGTKNNRRVFDLLDDSFSQIICGQLMKIKTRNKYYWSDNSHNVMTKPSYRRRYRCMVQRDQDTVRKICRIVDSIETLQSHLLEDQSTREYLLPKFRNWCENGTYWCGNSKLLEDDELYERQFKEYLHYPEYFSTFFHDG